MPLKLGGRRPTTTLRRNRLRLWIQLGKIRREIEDDLDLLWVQPEVVEMIHIPLHCFLLVLMREAGQFPSVTVCKSEWSNKVSDRHKLAP